MSRDQRGKKGEHVTGERMSELTTNSDRCFIKQFVYQRINAEQ